MTARAELRNIVDAKRYDRERFDDDTSFANWAQSRARHVLGPKPGDLLCRASDVEALRGAALWALMHHQGGSSPVGQPLRKALGIAPHADLTQEQFAEAKKAAGAWGAEWGLNV